MCQNACWDPARKMWIETALTLLPLAHRIEYTPVMSLLGYDLSTSNMVALFSLWLGHWSPLCWPLLWLFICLTLFLSLKTIALILMCGYGVHACIRSTHVEFRGISFTI